MRWPRLPHRWAWQAAPLLLLLLTGCGDDRPVMGTPDAPPRTPDAPKASPLAATSADDAPGGPPDPLTGDRGQTPSDPLVARHPLLGHDPLQGREMPTQHSHWLRGHLNGARVTVLLNGAWHGSFSGIIDQDITMSLRQGTNTVTFVYQPQAPGSAVDLEIVESEHNPQIAPLVTFHSEAGPAGGGDTVSGDALKPVTQTFPFVAN